MDGAPATVPAEGGEWGGRRAIGQEKGEGLERCANTHMIHT
jgi:hypothetical protein